jgi:hypothetical protein
MQVSLLERWLPSVGSLLGGGGAVLLVVLAVGGKMALDRMMLAS